VNELDELVAAVVRKLPAPGKPFPAEARAAWLRMAAMAFDVSYGAADELPAFLPPSALPAAKEPAAMGDVVAFRPAQASPKATKVLPRFLIDTDGIAKLNSGQRILPGDVVGPIYDLRGELGDLSSIVWADGTRGVAGLHLEISTSA
jgi:hypothetical protein